MKALQSLPNIGLKLERQLAAVGIETPEELARIGSKEAWLRIKTVDSSACYMRLCALEGAIRKVRWHDLDASVKAELKNFYVQHR
ncbi:MAG: TfoX/Sxy family protein [Candidatus Howiella sp.]|jgi:DNA transformation protein